MESTTFRVSEALTRDVGRGIVRLDPKDKEARGIATGDTVRVIGNRASVAKCLPAYAEDRDQGIIQMDGILRQNTQTGLGERVQVEKVACQPARTVVLQPQGEATGSSDMRHVTRVMASRSRPATRYAPPSCAAPTESSASWRRCRADRC